jgi:hypothetical protein
VLDKGLPNSVVFNYDASKAKTDSVFIVQTWDIRRKTLVSKQSKSHSAIYYYPGYFRTKLIADGIVVKTHDLQIATDGWLPLIEAEPNPIYLTKKDCVKNNIIEVTEQTLKANNLGLLPVAPKVRFFNQGDFGDLMNDNFTFETKVKSGFKGGSNACQSVEVLIQCKDDIIIIPLCNKACIGNLILNVAGIQLDSKSVDLSKFGADMSQWVHLMVVAKNKHVQLFVNGVEAYSLTFPNVPTGIVGVQYRFNGIGVVKDTEFTSLKGQIFTL